MLALVTGSTGFVGSQLCRELISTGHRVRAFHRPKSSLTLLDGLDVEHAVGDITIPETLLDAIGGVDVVFHTASKVSYWRDSSQMYLVTVDGTRNVFQVAGDLGVARVVYTSSAAALGVPDKFKQGREAPPQLINENHVWNYRPKWWLYGHAKHLAEKEVQSAVAGGLDVVIVNPSTIIGPGDINRISGEIIIQVARGLLKVALPGGMNVVHVADVARGHIAAWHRGRNGERYILGGENITHVDFLQIIAEITGVSAPTFVVPAWVLHSLTGPVDVIHKLIPLPINGDLLRLADRFFYFDTSKARDELGLEKKIPLRQGVEETFNWYRDNGMV